MKNRRAKRINLVVATALFVVLAAQLWIRLEIVGRGYELEELRAEIVETDARYRGLAVEYEGLVTPDKLKQRAERELGLRALEPARVRRMYDDQALS